MSGQTTIEAQSANAARRNGVAAATEASAPFVSALKREIVVYRHFVQAQIRCSNHISAVRRYSQNEELTAMVCAEIIAMNKVLDKPRKQQAKRIRKYARQLPVSAWVKSISGAGMLNLGLIVGEAGDLSNYSKPAKLWKRFGLHVMPDGRGARKFKDRALAELAGFSPRRRSVMYVVGDCLIRHTNIYRDLYDERKALEVQRIGTAGHAHFRAHRYMEKRFLLDLWKAWVGHSHHDTRPECAAVSSTQ